MTSCNGLHHSCPCRSAMTEEMEDVLRIILTGLNNYSKTLTPSKCRELRGYVPCLESAASLLRRMEKV